MAESLPTESITAGGPAAALSADQKRAQMQKFRWFHSIDLGDGVVTPGLKPLDRLRFQSDRVFSHPIEGQSMLDIGCWDGHFSFEAKRRGAGRVLATDHYVWNGPGWGQKGAFDLARSCLAPSVEDLEVDFQEMTPKSIGTFDVVLFLGVLYHLKEPLSGIERAASLAEKMLVVETHIDLRLAPEPPAMVLYPFDELNKDKSNWFGPNPSAVVGMLRTCGFSRVEIDEQYTWPGSSRALFHAIR